MRANLGELKTVEDLNSALHESRERPVLLFKHSLTCPISTRAFNELQSYLERGDTRVSCKLITVQTARDVSNEAASLLGLSHESPQAILIRNGSEVWSASHNQITASALDHAVRQAID